VPVATIPATNTKAGTMTFSHDFFLNIGLPPYNVFPVLSLHDITINCKIFNDFVRKIPIIPIDRQNNSKKSYFHPHYKVSWVSEEVNLDSLFLRMLICNTMRHEKIKYE